MFRVGMKVEQFKPWPTFDTAYPDVRFTKMGVVYSIREILTVRGVVALRFNELINPAHSYAGFSCAVEQAFPASFFRPVTSSKQEVSFTTGAPVDSERWDNRVKRKPQKVITALQSQAQQPSQI